MTISGLSSPILVTGASGFLGEHLVRHLVSTGCGVVGTCMSRQIDIPGATVVPVDLCDAGSVSRLVRDLRPGTVFHCAAITDAAQCQRDPAAARAAIVDATAHLACAVREFVPGAWLCGMSTDQVFDGESAPYAEHDEAKPISVYGSLKLEAEGRILEVDGGCVVRPTLMYGPPATHKGSFLAWMVTTLAQGRNLELFEDEVRTPVFVEDLCEALAGLGRTRAVGLWHAGGADRISRLGMGVEACRVFGLDEKLLVSRRLAESNYAAPRPRDVSLDSRRLWSALGLSPRGFADGLKRIAELAGTTI